MNSRLTGLEILEGWKTKGLRDEYAAEDVTDLLLEELKSWSVLGQHIDALAPDANITELHGQNLKSFVYDLEGQNRALFWQKMVAEVHSPDTMKLALSVNHILAPAICEAVGIQVGKPGVGVFPTASLKLAGEDQK